MPDFATAWRTLSGLRTRPVIANRLLADRQQHGRVISTTRWCQLRVRPRQPALELNRPKRAETPVYEAVA